MKHKNSELPAYWILALFGIVITASIIIYVKLFYEDMKRTSDTVMEQTSELADDLNEYEITMYEEEEIKGSEAVNYIKRHLGRYTPAESAPFFVRVKTVFAGTTYINEYTNKAHIKDIRDVSAVEKFIKPMGCFYCEVIRSENKVILGVSFTQK
jgi:hypothetical protein